MQLPWFDSKGFDSTNLIMIIQKFVIQPFLVTVTNLTAYEQAFWLGLSYDIGSFKDKRMGSVEKEKIEKIVKSCATCSVEKGEDCSEHSDHWCGDILNFTALIFVKIKCLNPLMLY